MLGLVIRNRKILAPGKGDLPNFQNGTKVMFHFKTVALFDENSKSKENDNSAADKDSTCACPHSHDHTNLSDRTIDDSKQTGNKPMELFIGKQFKFPLWEEWIKEMRIGERSEITIDWKLVGEVYPLLSKSYRNFSRPPPLVDYETEESRMKRTSTHCCGMQHKKGFGYKDLDELVEHPPAKLQFTLELIQVESPDQADKEIWLMNEEEMNKNLPIFQKEGNELFAQKNYEEAALKYRKGLAILEQLMMREKPNDEEWIQMDRKKIPLLSNLAQCELFLNDYYQVLEHTDEVLQKDGNNVKALFRRAKAHAAVWNVEQAKNDFTKAMTLDPSLKPLVIGQLAELELKVKEQDAANAKMLKGKLFA